MSSSDVTDSSMDEMPDVKRRKKSIGDEADVESMKVGLALKQVTRVHNIVAYGCAGASNPHPHLTPPPTHTPKAS